MPSNDANGDHNGSARSTSTYENILPVIRSELEKIASEGGIIGGVLSPFLTCEEAFLLAKFCKDISDQARLYLGHVPVIGEDDHYPKDRKGRSLEPVRFTIRAEKCPNRRGVEAILQHFEGQVRGFDEALQTAESGELRALYLTASYPSRLGPWITDEQAEKLKRVGTLIVQDLLPSPASAVARFVLPGASFAEKDGMFVNHAGLAQAIHAAVHPFIESRTEGQTFADLLGRPGLFHAQTIRKELAAEATFFSGLANGDLGEYGIRVGQAVASQETGA